MKKSFSLVLALIMCLSLAACSSEKVDSSEMDSSAGNATADSPAESSTMTEIPQNPAGSSAMEEKADSVPGDTTVTDKEGNIYTLSNPIMYMFSRAEVEAIDMSSMDMTIEGEPYDESYFGPASEYLDTFYWPELDTIYAVPEGTIITIPDNMLTETVFELDIALENGVFCANEFNTIMYPGFSSVSLDGNGYILTICSNKSEPANNELGQGSLRLGHDSAVSFYVPEDVTAPNPFDPVA